ncbi:MAG: hypothetical protein BGP24_05545 [Lysobacterales bacterium 69-70]|nr:hypothetical protein [Xanthomonadaceae bacterium]ODU34829.1 MAG: hypothetical protein ABS97_06530 [Xanthomonadaceae bacterium SCN 69-320]ODV19722.1 MAG: hypothetical protein ABT27_09895 [Xanthomonadaceae bacterium SCN 69-25]OJY95081.1 MAG: hypothetical protein BGP24_05545 [Xanthomonadales bacterium 69-70]
MGRISRLQSEVDASARRFDAAVEAADAERRDLKRLARALSPKLLIGVGLAGGFLLMVLPRHLRGSTLIGLGKFALARLLPLLAAQESDE